MHARQELDSVVVVADTVTEDEKEFAGANDTTAVSVKAFDAEEVDQLKKDPALNYKEPPSVAENLWTRFLIWLSTMLARLVGGVAGNDLGQVIFIILGIGLVVFIIMIVLKVDAFRIFHSAADKGKIKSNVFHENIHEMDFEKLIGEACNKGDYRMGVRLTFLYALKILSDKHLIEWHAGKTNHDYVSELKTTELQSGLSELSYYFDYAWYGGFVINRDTFQKVDQVFRLWKSKVN